MWKYGLAALAVATAISAQAAPLFTFTGVAHVTMYKDQSPKPYYEVTGDAEVLGTCWTWDSCPVGEGSKNIAFQGIIGRYYYELFFALDKPFTMADLGRLLPGTGTAMMAYAGPYSGTITRAKLTGVTVIDDGQETSWNYVSLGKFTPGIPEPASWALMIGGLCIAGAALRHRTPAVSFA